MSEPFRVSMSVRRLTVTLAVVTAALVVLHVVMWTVFFETSVLDAQGHWISMLDLDTEASFGTWFSSVLLLVAGVLTLMQANAGRGASDRRERWWWVLGLALLAASLDEVAGFHESLNTDVHFTAVLGHWTVAGAILGAVLGAAFLPFLWRLPLRTRVLFMVAGIVYMAGAVGVEFATIGYERDDLLNTLPYNLWNALEEGLEMAGIVIYLHAILGLMAGKVSGKVAARVTVRR